MVRGTSDTLNPQKVVNQVLWEILVVVPAEELKVGKANPKLEYL